MEGCSVDEGRLLKSASGGVGQDVDLERLPDTGTDSSLACTSFQLTSEQNFYTRVYDYGYTRKRDKLEGSPLKLPNVALGLSVFIEVAAKSSRRCGKFQIFRKDTVVSFQK